MARGLIGVGSNVGNRTQILNGAVDALAAHPQIHVVARSRWLPMAPIGGPLGQGEFLNGAVLVETDLSPQHLLSLLLELEDAAGRRRGERWDARTLDLDLLLYNGLSLDMPELTLPHPAMAFRRFVLQPAAEISGEMIHPTIGWTVRQLLEHLNEAPAYVAVTGTPMSGRSRLAEVLAKRHGMDLIVDPAGSCVLEGAATDPAGPSATRAIELVERRQRALAAMGPGPAAEPTVSDFWFDDCLAFGSLELSGSAWLALQEAWNKARGAVPVPKLLIALGHWRVSERVGAGTGQSETPEARREALLESAIMALARRPSIGPVLRLERSGDFERQLADASAAIEAMK